jgi:SAM-dependent methyltransferase
MVWLDPIPVEEDISEAYRSYYTHETDSVPAENLARRFYSRVRTGYLRTKYDYRQGAGTRWDQLFAFLAYLNPIRRASFDFSVFYLRSKVQGRLLELGCGSGAMLQSMEGLGWRVDGVDFDPVAVAQARDKGLTVHLGSLSEHVFPTETFDAITASHVIEHVCDPLGVLRECRRILKPGGLLVLITPNAASWGHRIYRADWRGLEPPRHIRIFTPFSLATLCRRAGFNLVLSRSMVRSSGILLASRRLKRGERVLSGRPGWPLRLWDEIRSLVQWAGTFVDPEAGEEILSVSAK